MILIILVKTPVKIGQTVSEIRAVEILAGNCDHVASWSELPRTDEG